MFDMKKWSYTKHIKLLQYLNVKNALGMWMPNSKQGHKIRSLEGENEIPTIRFFIFQQL